MINWGVLVYPWGYYFCVIIRKSGFKSWLNQVIFLCSISFGVRIKRGTCRLFLWQFFDLEHIDTNKSWPNVLLLFINYPYLFYSSYMKIHENLKWGLSAPCWKIGVWLYCCSSPWVLPWFTMTKTLSPAIHYLMQAHRSWLVHNPL